MTLRVVLYLVAVALSLALAGRFATVPDRLARLLAGMSVAWAVNALILLMLLIHLTATGDADPTWRSPLLTINAVLLAAAPVLLYALFPGETSR